MLKTFGKISRDFISIWHPVHIGKHIKSCPSLTEKLCKHFISSVLTQEERFLVWAYPGTLFPLLFHIGCGQDLQCLWENISCINVLRFNLPGMRNMPDPCAQKGSRSAGNDLSVPSRVDDFFPARSNEGVEWAGWGVFCLSQVHFKISGNIRPPGGHWYYSSWVEWSWWPVKMEVRKVCLSWRTFSG